MFWQCVYIYIYKNKKTTSRRWIADGFFPGQEVAPVVVARRDVADNAGQRGGNHGRAGRNMRKPAAAVRRPMKKPARR